MQNIKLTASAPIAAAAPPPLLPSPPTNDLKAGAFLAAGLRLGALAEGTWYEAAFSPSSEVDAFVMLCPSKFSGALKQPPIASE